MMLSLRILVIAKRLLRPILSRKLQLGKYRGQAIAKQMFRFLKRRLVDINGLVEDILECYLLARHSDKPTQDTTRFSLAITAQIDAPDWESNQRTRFTVGAAEALGHLVQISDDNAIVGTTQWRVEQVPRHRHRSDVLASDLLNEKATLVDFFR
jgi:hypothetical protein